MVSNSLKQKKVLELQRQQRELKKSLLTKTNLNLDTNSNNNQNRNRIMTRNTFGRNTKLPIDVSSFNLRQSKLKKFQLEGRNKKKLKSRSPIKSFY